MLPVSSTCLAHAVAVHALTDGSIVDTGCHPCEAYCAFSNSVRNENILRTRWVSAGPEWPVSTWEFVNVTEHAEPHVTPLTLTLLEVVKAMGPAPVIQL